MINKKKLDFTMDYLGFSKRLAGTAAVAAAVEMVAQQRDIAMTKELYPALAQASGRAAWGQIERNMRYAIQEAMDNCESNWDAFCPGRRTTKEVLVRMAALCDEN